MPHVKRARPAGAATTRTLGFAAQPLNRTTDDWIARLADAITVTPDGCWVYGDEPSEYVKLNPYGKVEGVHRLVYREIHGPIPPRWHVHHTCEVPACINPAHLVALSPGDHRRAHAALRRTR